MNSIPMDTPMECGDDDDQPDQVDQIFTNSDAPCSNGQITLSNERQSKQMVLIRLVSEKPAIFNPKHEDYRNIIKKDELWMDMAKQVGWTDGYCKNKWKAIRDQYCRELKRTRTNSNAKIKWKFFKSLEFLRPYALSRNYRTRLRKNQNRENEDMGYQEESSSNTQEESCKATILSENEINSTNTSEQWDNLCDNTDLLYDSNDITSQIIMQLSQTANNPEEESIALPQEPQDDDDDDPINTFLNIESYFERELITLVSKMTVLYDTSHPFYRNTRDKMEIWEGIAKKLNKTVQQCRLKWKALRDQYFREHKRILNKNTCSNLPRWKHHDAMAFLEPYIKKKKEKLFHGFSRQYRVMTIDDSSNVNNDSSTPDFEPEEIINLPNKDDNNELTQFQVLADDDTSGIYTEHLYSPRQSSVEVDEEDDEEEEEQQGDEQKLECNQDQNEKTDHLLIEHFTEVTEVTEAQSSSNEVDLEDEVGAFFRAVAIKIRKANMSSLAFTELQIDILKVITNALKN